MEENEKLKPENMASAEQPETVPESKEPVPEEKESKGQDFLDLLKDLSYMLAVTILLFLFFFRLAVVDGSSMEPTLYNEDRLLLLSNFLYADYQAGDVVVVHEKDFTQEFNLVKRVIAHGGQTVDIDFDAGIVYLDGEPQEEPYVNTPTNLYEGMDFPVTVPEGKFFVMGDNRNNSKDSRDPEVGFVDRSEIFGRAAVLYFPGPTANTDKREFSRIGAVK